MNGNSKLDRDSDDIGGLAALPGLKAVRDQLAARITVLKAEQARRNAGAEIRRPAWKNLIYRGFPAFDAANYTLQRLAAHGGEIRSVCQP